MRCHKRLSKTSRNKWKQAPSHPTRIVTRAQKSWRVLWITSVALSICILTSLWFVSAQIFTATLEFICTLTKCHSSYLRVASQLSTAVCILSFNRILSEFMHKGLRTFALCLIPRRSHVLWRTSETTLYMITMHWPILESV